MERVAPAVRELSVVFRGDCSAVLVPDYLAQSGPRLARFELQGIARQTRRLLLTRQQLVLVFLIQLVPCGLLSFDTKENI